MTNRRNLRSGWRIRLIFLSLLLGCGSAFPNLVSYRGHILDGASYTHDPFGLRTNIVRDFGLTTNSVTVGESDGFRRVGRMRKPRCRAEMMQPLSGLLISR